MEPGGIHAAEAFEEDVFVGMVAADRIIGAARGAAGARRAAGEAVRIIEPGGVFLALGDVGGAPLGAVGAMSETVYSTVAAVCAPVTRARTSTGSLSVNRRPER